MKAKTIRKILQSKVESLASHIQVSTTQPLGTQKATVYFDTDLPHDVLQGTIVTGGSIVSMLQQEPVNDYDIYFKTRELALRVARFYLWQFKGQNEEHLVSYIELLDPRSEAHGGTGAWRPLGKTSDGEYGEINSVEWAMALQTTGRFRIVIKSAGIASSMGQDETYAYFESLPDQEGEGYIEALTKADETDNDVWVSEEAKNVAEKGDHYPKFISGNAITLAGDLQVMIRFFGEPKDIHANYDFIHCTCYYTSWDKHLELPQAALEAIITKELRYVGSLYPLCSIIRLRKFIKRGWWVNAGQILKMTMQLNDLDLTDVDVLEDQLTGVDTAYFMHIIARLRSSQEKKIEAMMEEQKISRTEAENKVGNVDSAYVTTIIDRIF